MSEANTGKFRPGLVAAAHELKSPLVLLRQLSFQIDNEAVASRVKLTSERALRLVDGLTKAARLEDGLFELAPLNICQVMSESVAEITPLADAKGIEILVARISRGLPVAVGNRDLLRAILTNLIDNALDYTCQKIELRAGVRQQELEIAVRDYGETIELNEFRHLQQNLGHRGQALADRPLSSGLGLLVASQMSRAMHGNLRVERHRKGGLTFTVTMPAVQQLSLLGR